MTTHLHATPNAGQDALGPHTTRLRQPAFQAFALLRTVFTVATIAFGADKFFNRFTTWEPSLSPFPNRVIPGIPHQAMLMVGVVEVAAGLLVALRPRIGGY